MASNFSLDVVCPSGLKGRLRGMKGRDEQIFLDAKIRKNGDPLNHLLLNCWEVTTFPGPYDPSNFSWILASTADRTHALIQLRIASFGEDYEFQATCEACSHIFGWGVDLNELDVAPTSEEGRRYLATGEPMTVTLSCGQVIKTRILNGDDEKYLANLGPKDRARVLTFHLARRVVEINEKTKWTDIIAEIEELPARYSGELWDATDAHEGGVDTSFTIECPKCDREQRVNLPFSGSFFSNRKQFAGSKTRSNG